MPLVDDNVFWSRLNQFYTVWRANKGSKAWGNGATSLVALRGVSNEDIQYEKSASLFTWLFGGDLPNTMLVFCANALYIVSSVKISKALSNLAQTRQGLEVVFLVYAAKTSEEFGKQFQRVLSEITSGSDDNVTSEDNIAQVGMCLQEKPKGTFATDFRQLVKDNNQVKLVEVGLGFMWAQQVKDENEIADIRKCAEHTSAVLKKHLVKAMENVIEEERKVPHSKLAEDTENVMIDEPHKVNSKLSVDHLDAAYTPIVMSGSTFNLRPSAQSNDDFLNTGTGSVILALGARYKNYCTNIARTYFINPSKEQQETYTLLERVYRDCLAKFLPGNPVNGVWKTAQDVIKRSARPEYANNFTDNCGFGTGINFRDPTLVLKEKSTRTFAAGMVFDFCIGFNNLQFRKKDGTMQPYAVLLADTILITENGADILTNVRRSYQAVIYSLDDEDDDDEVMATPEPKKKKTKREVKVDSGDEDVIMADMSGGGGRSMRTRPRNATVKPGEDEELEKEYRRDLEARKTEEALRKLRGETDGKSDDDHDKVEKEFIAYESPSHFPPKAKKGVLYVDARRHAVLVPLFGRLVPFHVNVIKNVNKTEQGDFVYLRINFITPGTASTTNRAHRLPGFADPSAMFIQELTYRSSGMHLNEVYFQLKEMKRRINAQNREMEEKQTLVTQERLQLFPNNVKHFKLRDVQIRPALARGKGTGSVTVHKNGLRYHSTKGQSLEVIFKNIKHAILQPAQRDTLQVILHLQLKHPIIVNKKKAEYVQFYYEVTDATQDLDTHGGGENDAILEEQNERRTRKRWNERFRELSKAIETQAAVARVQLEFDVPYPKLGFKGVPNKETLKVIPSVNCLVALDDNPPFCLTLDEVDIVNFERVSFNIRNFDMAFVFKDFTKTPVRIDAIPIKDLEDIKKWLRSINMLYYESRANLVWKNILAEISRDKLGFYEEGGWHTLLGDDDEQNGDGSSDGGDSSGEEDAYEPSGSDDDEDEYESDSSLDEDDDDDEEMDDDDDDDEEEEDWDALEKKAAADDRRRWSADIDARRPVKKRRR